MALSRSLACPNSKQWLLKSLISTFAIPQSALPQRRTFIAPTRRRNEARERMELAGKDVAFALNDIKEGERESFQDEPQSEPQSTAREGAMESSIQDHIPWYLRTSSPLPSTAPESLSARQRIPDLPEYPPPLLAPLLHQVSVDLGIDDLTLLDLRSLDPPPALGANLLMLIGTARSEKHLHVSADKLCRWLRSEHYLSPFADGLLGRQELKLKLRRKAKRNKLMSAVGWKESSRDSEDLAEGIRTGWVCVNVGVVPGAEGEVQEPGEVVLEKEGEFVGFGPGGTQGVRIVVQMLTEEKRGEVDLEKLWLAVLKKSEREKEAIAKQEAVEEEVDEHVENRSEPAPAKVKAELLAAEVESTAQEEAEPQHSPARIRGLRGRQHIRSYHTSARKLQGPSSNRDSTPETSPEEFYRTFTTFPALRVPRSAILYTTLFNHISSGAFPRSSDILSHLRDDGTVLGNAAADLDGLPMLPGREDLARQTLEEIRGAAEGRSMLSETLCAMESEVPKVDLETSGVELCMAVLKSIRKVDPEGLEKGLQGWRGRCERALRKALKEQDRK